MRLLLGMMLAVVLGGCSRPNKNRARKVDSAFVSTNLPTNSISSKARINKTIPVPPKIRGIAVLHGQVVSTNPALKFAVVAFSGGVLPEKEQRLSIYRSGVKVGEIKMTGPFQSTSGVGDISTGEAAVGDLVQVE